MGSSASCFCSKGSRVVPLEHHSQSQSYHTERPSLVDVVQAFEDISEIDPGSSKNKSKPLLNENNKVMESGHAFKKKTFHKPTYCHHCSDLLWGLTNQGVQCTVCGYISHEKCQSQLVAPCSIETFELIQMPSLHTLIKNNSEKKRFCNVCRKRVDDSDSFTCQVCCYYVHNSCQKLVLQNCKISASFTRKTEKMFIPQFHHWCEGHLPMNSKCVVCNRHCSSTDVLTGLRCSWCLITIHSFCITRFSVHCNFGSTYSLVLPPYIVKQLNLNSISRNTLTTQVTPDEDLCSVLNTNERVLRIYEGPAENPIGWRNIKIHEASTTLNILNDALQKFHIKEEKSKYYLTRLRGSTEVQIGDDEKPWLLVRDKKYDEPNIFLRHVPALFELLKYCDPFSLIATFSRTPQDVDVKNQRLEAKEIQLKLYAGFINSIIRNVKLNVNLMSPASDIIVEGLKAFQLDNEDPNDYCITQLKLTSKRVRETCIEDKESIYEVLVEKRKQTITELHRTRFYLQPKQLPAENISLYIENLPRDLAKQQYQVLLTETVGNWESGMTITAVFPAQGAVVIEFETDDVLFQVIKPLNSGFINGKKLKLHILPEIKVDVLPKDICPIIIFVNGKSGGGQGWKLLTSFKRLLNPYQVVDLLDGGPMPILYMFRKVPRFRILICGGDGTFAWVLSCLEDIRYNILRCKQPAAAVLPLGTGNDLARILNWGAGYSGESPLHILKNVMSAKATMLDRWNVVFDSNVFPLEDPTKEPQPPTILALNNYFGVGVDAELCLQFHESREEKPEKFDSRLYNKGVYFKTGLKNMANRTMSNLQDRIELQVDDIDIDLPSIEGLAVLNIASWGAGSDPWGKDRDERFKPSAMDDGMLEVVGFTGVYHMGKIKSGLSSGIRIAQGTQINVRLKENLPVQVDGEPWRQASCRIMIRPTLQQAKMLMRTPSSHVQRSQTPPLEERDADRQRRYTYDATQSNENANWYQ